MIRTRQLGFEGLERRAMLATVGFSGGILTIHGTDAPETVTVTEVTPGTVTVTGTGIAAPVTRSGVIGIVAEMRGGDDRLNIGNAANSVDLQGAVTILLGNDSDVANLFINTPAGVTVDGGFETGAVAQDDIITVTNSNIGTLAVNTYAGSDFLDVFASNFITVAANLGMGSLTAGQIDADGFRMNGGGAFTAAVTLGTSETGAANGVRITGSAFDTLSIIGGEGRDVVLLTGVVATNVVAINTLGGNDTIGLNTVVATNALSISAGAGADNLTLIAVATNVAVLDGGPGIDTLNDDASPAIVTRLKFGWEIDDPLL
jgi:hypothetical protein